MNRRDLLKAGGLLTGAIFMGECAAPSGKRKVSNFSYCLNTSTIRGQKLGIVKEIQMAAEAGYDGIEIWLQDVQAFLKEGGSPGDLKKQAEDLGIRLESAISFPHWIVDDATERTQAIEQAKQEMDLLAQIGCPRLAAPPLGLTSEPGVDLQVIAQRLRALLEVGEQMGVRPLLELWGFAANLHRLGEVVYVAVESGHPNAALLLDVYHIYRGGSDFNGLKLISGDTMPIFHMNDYPAEPPRESIQDSDRVFPGDGIAPFDQIIPTLNEKNRPIVLSLELFRRDLWEKDALDVAKTGLEKMKSVVDSALAA